MALVQRPPPITECPSSPDYLHFATYWYRMPSVPDFLVCTKCFEDKIAITPFASCFELFYHVPIAGKNATCNFNSLTVDRIFNNALQHSYGDPNALATLTAHARNRVPVKTCPGMDGAGAEQGIRWYGIPQIPDFMACEACYLDFICGSVFVTNFTPYPTQQPQDHTWACDVAVPNIKRHLTENSKTYDWAGFVNAASHRIRQQACDGSEQSLTQRNWYTPRALPNMLICETCYLDEVSLTQNMGQFCNLRSNWTSTPPSTVSGRCTFANLAVKVCSNQLLERNFNAWIHLVSRILSLPPCRAENIQDGDFYLLVNPWTHQATDFGFCEACYTGCFESSDNGHLFRRERLPGLGFCEFSQHNPRMGESVQRLTELLFTRDTTKMIDYAVHLQPQSLESLQPQQASTNPHTGTSNWQAISAQLAQQHAMKMGMMNMVFAQNTMHNAAMQGILSQGSSYNKWHDHTYTTAQYNYSQAQNQMFGAMGGGYH